MGDLEQLVCWHTLYAKDGHFTGFGFKSQSLKNKIRLDPKQIVHQLCAFYLLTNAMQSEAVVIQNAKVMIRKVGKQEVRYVHQFSIIQ